MDLDQSIALVKGVGEKTYNNLIEKSIYTVKDALLYFPRKYTIYEKVNLLNLNEDKNVLISGTILSYVFRKLNPHVDMAIIYLNHYGKKVKCIFFGASYLKFQIKKDQFVTICGLFNLEKDELRGKKIVDTILDFYIETDYKIDNVSNQAFNKIVNTILKSNIDLTDDLPLYLEEKYKLISFKDFIFKSHNPIISEDIRQINRRKKYYDYLKFSLSLINLEKSLKISKKEKRNPILFSKDIFKSSINFSLTLDQKKALSDVENDILSDNIMNRLIEGDVGCGKTIVSFYASLLEIKSGMQVLFMAPTEILARQHFESFKKFASKFNVESRLLTSSIKEIYKKEIINGLKENRINILFSTQAILYKENAFSSLGLIVIDEQHRFGVRQRSKLLNEYKNCDALYLSATPIPRTLGISKFGDLSLTEIKSKPELRKEVKTKIIDFSSLDCLKDKIKEEISMGHQIFVVVSQIDESSLDLVTLLEAKEIFLQLVPNTKIKTLSGRVKDSEKDKIMMEFKNKEFDILISTTVIEVGIDIPNATMIFILNADRFGVSTLHQLRGRVGRSNLESYCYLVTNNIEHKTLNALKDCSDCFKLAEIDLETRGPGDLLGTDQSGFLDLDFKNDIKIYNCAKNDAKEICDKNLDLDIVKNTINENNGKQIKLN